MIAIWWSEVCTELTLLMAICLDILVSKLVVTIAVFVTFLSAF